MSLLDRTAPPQRQAPSQRRAVASLRGDMQLSVGHHLRWSKGGSTSGSPQRPAALDASGGLLRRAGARARACACIGGGARMQGTWLRRVPHARVPGTRAVKIDRRRLACAFIDSRIFGDDQVKYVSAECSAFRSFGPLCFASKEKRPALEDSRAAGRPATAQASSSAASTTAP